MNFHPTNANIYPSRDHIPACILSEFVEPDQADYTSRCCAFFAAIFRVFQTHLSMIMKDCHGNYPEASLRWTSRMLGPSTSNRDSFFQDVEREFDVVRIPLLTSPGCLNMPSQILRDIKEHSPKSSPPSQHISQFAPPATAISAQAPLSTTPPVLASVKTPTPLDKTGNIAEPWVYGKNHLIYEYSHMLEAFPGLFQNDPDTPKVVLVFDEASYLKQSARGGQKFSPVDVVCRIISAYSRIDRASVWALFLSTESKIADFSAPAPMCAY